VVNPRSDESNEGRASRNQEKSRKALPVKKKKERKRRKELNKTKDSYSWALSYSAATGIGPRVEHQQLRSLPKVAITLQPANRNSQSGDE
jgi:hypothetical protein